MYHPIHNKICVGLVSIVVLVFVLSMPYPALSQSPELSFERQVSPGTIRLDIDEPLLEVSLTLTGNNVNCPTEVIGKPADIILSVDRSNSMEDPLSVLFGVATKLDALKEAAGIFIEEVDLSVNRVGVVQFDSGAFTLQDLTNDKKLLAQAIDSLTASGGTSIDQGIKLAQQMLDMNRREQVAMGVIILLSDGGSDASRAEKAAKEAKAHGYQLITIGYGIDANQELLKSLASKENDYYFAPDGDELEKIYTSIAQSISQPGAASQISVIHRFDASNFEVIPGSISANGVLDTSTITWNVPDLADGSIELQYQVRPRSIGTFNIDLGDTISYFACQNTNDRRQFDELGGLPVQIFQPTPTFTPIPTATLTPFPTLIPTASLINLPTPESTPFTIAGLFCASPWWLTLIFIILLLLSILYLIWRVWKEIQGNPDKEGSWFCHLCHLWPLLLIPWLVGFLWLVTDKATDHFCSQRESVYFWRIDGEGKAGVYLTTAAGFSNVRPFKPINHEDDCVGCHVVSDSSDKVAAIAGGGLGKVVIYGLDGKEITIPDVQASYIAFSPDGNRLALSDSNNDIKILDLGTGQVYPLEGANDPDVVETMPTWGTNNQIAFVRAKNSDVSYRLDSPCDIFIVSADGGIAQPLRGASGQGFNYYPAFSPDGKWLAFTHHVNGSTTYSDPYAEIYLVQATGGESIRLEANDAPDSKLDRVSNSWATWSRNSQKLAFNSKRSDYDYDIFVTEIGENGHSGPAIPLYKAANKDVFEHLPYWGEPPKTTIWSALLPLWPYLLLLLIPVLLWLLCKLLCKEHIENIQIHMPIKKRPTPNPLPPLQLVAPLQIAPALVIGVGGSGRWVLTHLKKNLLDAGLGNLPEKIKFLLLDTAQAETRIAYKTDTGEPVVSFAGVSLQPSEILVLHQDLAKVIEILNENDDAYLELREWFPYMAYSGVGKQTDLTGGTFGRRSLARVGLIRSLQLEEEKSDALSSNGDHIWKALVDNIQAVTEGDRVRVIIVGSLAGGMSGTLVDLAYLAHRACGDKSVQMEGYFTTYRAFPTITNSMKLNTWASIRELARFQLAAGWPYLMEYGLKNETLKNKKCSWRLFDDIFLYGRPVLSASQGTKSSEPWATVFATIADSISFRLDKGASTGWQNLRDAISMQIIAQQKAQGNLVVSSLGSFVYRLPLFDILNEIKLRWAIDLLRTGLGIDNNNDLESVNKQVSEETNRFWSGMMGVGTTPAGLTFIGKLGQDGAERSSLNITPAISRELIDALNKDNLQLSTNYINQAVDLLLNGRVNSANTQQTPWFFARVEITRGFLEKSKTMLETAKIRAKASEKLGIDWSDNAEKLADLWLTQFERLLISLGATITHFGSVNTSQDSNLGVYARLRKGYELAQQHRKQMNMVAVREYLWRQIKDPNQSFDSDSNTIELADEWYAKYCLPYIEEFSDRLYWKVDPDGKIHLTLIAFQDRSVTLDSQDSVKDFIDELMRTGEYLLRDVWGKVTLADMLIANGLTEPEEVANKTAERVWMMAEPPLNRNATTIKNSAAVGINNEIYKKAPDLANALSDPLNHLESHCSPAVTTVVSHTDHLAFPLVRASDFIPIDSESSLVDARDMYLATLGKQSTDVEPSEFTSSFAAERNALRYEMRLPEIGQPPRSFNPYVVIALHNEERVRDFLLAWVNGWIIETSGSTRLTLPGKAPMDLHKSDDLLLLPGLVAALVRFSQSSDENNSESLHQHISGMTNVEDRTKWQLFRAEWEKARSTGKIPERFEAEGILQDIAMLAALIVIEHLDRLPAIADTPIPIAPQPTEPTELSPELGGNPSVEETKSDAILMSPPYPSCPNSSCKNYGHLVTTKFCTECGSRPIQLTGLPRGVMTCANPDCQKYSQPVNTKFCTDCGRRVVMIAD